MPTNAEVIFNTVFHSTELTERPFAVLDCVKANNGKRLTKPVLAKMSETLGFEVATRTTASMTYLCFLNGQDNTQMIVAYDIKGIVLDAEFFEKHNTAHLSAALHRNGQRSAILSNQPAIDELAAAVEAFKAAEARLKAAFAPFDVSRYTIERNLDLRKD